MGRRFFDLQIDAYVPGRWYMSEPTRLNGQEIEDVWAFTNGEPIKPPGFLRIPLLRPGRPLDFTTAGVGLTPILSGKAAAIFKELAPQDIQLFPVEVEGQTEPFYLLVVIKTVRCIDDVACSDIQLFTENGLMPERAGEYRVVSGLRIDKSKVGDVRVFKTWGWSPALIIDEEIRNALDQNGFVGGHFEEV
ncbi:hypothetical protein I3V78_16905 [Archangium primigenium]|nr:hypothetical protein [Archangium primigenium]